MARCCVGISVDKLNWNLCRRLPGARAMFPYVANLSQESLTQIMFDVFYVSVFPLATKCFVLSQYTPLLQKRPRTPCLLRRKGVSKFVGQV